MRLPWYFKVVVGFFLPQNTLIRAQITQRNLPDGRQVCENLISLIGG